MSIDGNLLKLLKLSSKEFYRLVFDKKFDAYYSFRIPKKQHGTFREINAPVLKLRKILSNLSKTLSKQFNPTYPSHGFHPARSIVTNANMHYGKSWVLNIDLKDFFPSITEKRVFGALFAWKDFCKSWGLKKKEVFLLVKFCCYENKLPQGAPTSPVLSNLVARHLDRDLQRFSSKNNFVYTRYADDITFSPHKNRSDWSKLVHVDEVTGGKGKLSLTLSDRLIRIITKNDFQVNERKIRLQRNTDSMQVTGLVVNQRINVKRKIIRQTRAMLNAWEKYGLELADSEFREKYDSKERYDVENKNFFDQVVLGKINFIGMVRGKGDPIYIKLRDRLLKLQPNFRKSLSVDFKTFPERKDWNMLKNEEANSKKEVIVSENFLSSSSQKNLVDAVFRFGLAKTKESAKNCVLSGDIYVNGEPNFIPTSRVYEKDKISVSRSSYLKLWVKSRVNQIVSLEGGVRKAYLHKDLMSDVLQAEQDFMETRGKWINNIASWTSAWNKLASTTGDEVGKVFKNLPAKISKDNEHLLDKLTQYYENNGNKFCYSKEKEKLFIDLKAGGGNSNQRGQGLATLNLWVALAFVNSDESCVLRHTKRFDKAHIIEPNFGRLFFWLSDNRNHTKRYDLSHKQKIQFRDYFYRVWAALGVKI